MFSEELAKHGLKPRMDESYQAELPDLPAKPGEWAKSA